MVSYVFSPVPEPPASKRWLSCRFPHRSELITDLRQRIQRTPDPITACPPDPRHFGLAVERTLALDLCDTPPYPHLFDGLPETARHRLLTTAGYQPDLEPPDQRWTRPGHDVPVSRLFTVGNLLTDLEPLLRQLHLG